jgi:1-deoxy-D-xylulose-5-phosphate reductoisomerase
MPDMRTPISYALSWPRRMPLPGLERLDLAKIGRLDFTTPDPHRFPALGIARKAVFAGGGAPIVLNGANEVAVAAFLQRRIGFLTIAQVAGEVLDDFLNSQPSAAGPASFEHVYDLDRWARARTIEKLRLAA